MATAYSREEPVGERREGTEGPVRILLTGTPGVGKTTLVRRIVERLGGTVRASGFWTEERRGGRGRSRSGFDVVTLEGRRGPLAKVGGGGGASTRVGRYQFQQDAFEQLALPTLEHEDAELIVIDEIGKMECLSPDFVEAVRELFGSEKAILATVGLRGGGLLQEVKELPGVELLTVTHANRDRLVEEIAGRLMPEEGIRAELAQAPQPSQPPT